MSLSTIEQQKRLIYKIVPIRRKRKVKMYERRGGQAPPSWEYMSGVKLIRYGWIWLDTHTIPFIWPWTMTSVSTKKFDFNKNWKTKKQHNQNTSYHQKTFYMKIHQEKHKKGKINQSKPGVCAVLFILWFVFGVLVLFLVFLFVFWVSSFLFFCLQCFCIFLDLTIFQKCCVFQNHFSLQRASKQIPGSIQSWDRKKNRSKMYERKGGQPHPSLEYMSGFDMLRL